MLKHVYVYLGFALITIVAGLKPFYNWDSLPYSAILLEMDGVPPEKLCDSVYTLAKTHLPEKEYQLLIDKEGYRTIMQHADEGFYQQLPFYYIKPLYLGAAYLAYQLGFSLPYATVVPSLIAFYLLLLIVYQWTKKHTGSPVAFIICCTLALSLPFSGLARESSPDALSCFFMLYACLASLRKNMTFWVYLLFASAILTRPDNIIFVLLWYSGMWILAFEKLKPLLYGSVLAILAFILPKFWLDNYSYPVLFYHSFVEQLIFPNQASISLGLTDYLTVVLRNSYRELTQSYLLFIAAFFAMLYQQKKISKPIGILGGITTLAIAIRYTFFPVLTGRFMAFYYLLFFALILTTLTNKHEHIRSTH